MTKKHWRRYLRAQYGRYWKVHFAKKKKRKGHGIVCKYLDRYLKRPRYLRQNCGITEGAVDHHYRMTTRQPASAADSATQEKMIRRYISHIPAGKGILKWCVTPGFVRS
ncbi:transposase [Arsenophonus nasoniae]|uniref:transposase n=1 Tax=Arsenophonus nasoniae TaxID=638 RepID=UPI001FE80A93|nr:transposase [Arsenophonus nasoniae]